MLTYEVVDEGGSFIRSFSLAKKLVKLGHTVTLLASNKKPGLFERKTKRHGVVVIEIACPLPHRIRHNGTSPFQTIGRTVHVLRHRYDVVHGFGHRPSVFIPAFIHKFLYRRPYVADWADLWGWGGLGSYRGGLWGTTVGWLDDILEKFVYRNSDGVSVISRDLFQRARRFGVLQSHTAIVPPGSSVDEIVPLSKATQRKKYGFSIRDHILVYVGNAPYDARLLGKVIVEVMTQDDRARAIIIGRHMEEFDSVVRISGFKKRIRHYGFIAHDHISTLMACGDVMVLPYTNREINTNRYPNKIGDYLAAGRPTVANATGDLARLFRAYPIGETAPEEPIGFARVILLLLTDAKKRRVLGQNARRLAEREFSWRRSAESLDAFYLSILEEYHSMSTPRSPA